MNLEKLQELWKKDCQIDTDLYCEESIKIPQLHSRYLEFYNTYSLMKKEKEGTLNALKKDKWLYYKGCLLYTSPSPRDVEESRMPASA